jgi:hypothetical protein
MREHVGPEVSRAIHARANNRCECENLVCKHVARHCRNALDGNSRISLPAGVTTTAEKISKGRAVCVECFERSASYLRQPRST